MRYKIIIYILIIVVLFTIFGWIHRIQSKQTTVPVENRVEAVEIQKDELDLWLDKLAFCESGGSTTIEIIDSNKQFSRGPFMFQDNTFIPAVKKLNLLPEAEDKEILNFVYDYEFAKRVARILIENGEDWRWKNCVRKIGKPPVSVSELSRKK
jgi:hypothetical protein